jgi:hypothetical protein
LSSSAGFGWAALFGLPATDLLEVGVAACWRAVSDMSVTWLGMAVIAALQVACFITVRWLAGREERPRRETVVAIVEATPPGAWVQENRPDGTTLTVYRPAGTLHASIEFSPSLPIPSISEAMNAQNIHTGT